MYTLLQDRHTYEMFIASLTTCENDICITQVLGVLAQPSLHERHSIQLALDMMGTCEEESHVVQTLRHYLQMMNTSYNIQPHLYDVVYQLVHDVPIIQIYDTYSAVCPDILRQWNTLMMQENTEMSLMEPSRRTSVIHTYATAFKRI
jgi:hypothetical protein